MLPDLFLREKKVGFYPAGEFEEFTLQSWCHLSLRQPHSPACCLCFQKKPFHAGAGWIAQIPLVLRSLECFILQKHLWEGIR